MARLVQRVVAACDPLEVVLFGSYAKGTADRHSDIDLLIVTDRPPSPALVHAAFDATRAAIPVDVHVHEAARLVEAAADAHGFLGSIVRSGQSVYCAAHVTSVRDRVLFFSEAVGQWGATSAVDRTWDTSVS